MRSIRQSNAYASPPDDAIGGEMAFDTHGAMAAVLRVVPAAPPNSGRSAGEPGRSRRTVLDGPFTETKELIGGSSALSAKLQRETGASTERFRIIAVDGCAKDGDVRQRVDPTESGGPAVPIERARASGVVRGATDGTDIGVPAVRLVPRQSDRSPTRIANETKGEPCPAHPRR